MNLTQARELIRVLNARDKRQRARIKQLKGRAERLARSRDLWREAARRVGAKTSV